MSTVAEIKLWGKTIGAVSLEEGTQVASFQYASSFLRSDIKLAPFVMPLSSQVYRFPALPRDSFHGLPGLLADSLPDKFGNALIDAWLAREGRTPASFNAVERLCYTGRRGMGALEFSPAQGPHATKSSKLQVDRLVQLASDVLANRHGLRTALTPGDEEDALKSILQVGTSAGGARAKAVIAWDPKTNEVRSGQVEAPEGFGYWLLKFDGVIGNKDKEMEDPKGFCALEYAYYLMAKAAKITMSECRLFEENGRRHFMTRRFDRASNGEKLHMQSLGAMRHYDFNSPGAYGYEQAMQTIQELEMSMEVVEEQFRRMVFNVVARNQDDHVKNIAFLMNKQGDWSLAPAFDVTYSYNPTGKWTSQHQMSVNGKHDQFNQGDFEACAATAHMKRGRRTAIVQEVVAAVNRWEEFADEAKLPSSQRDAVRSAFRSDML